MPILPFNMQTQNQSNWCWAAVAVSTHLFYGGTQWPVQCGLVNQTFGLHICCQSGSSPACNKQYYLDQALQITGNYHHYTNGPELWSSVTQQINIRHPLGVRISLAGNLGHFLIINGYTVTPRGIQQVVLRDSLNGNSIVPYGRLVNGYQRGSWTHSFFTT
jgi:hypothetical protein